MPSIKRAYFQLFALASGGVKSVAVGDLRATFDVSTYEEYHVVKVADEAERPVLSRLLHHVRPDDVFYDVGANVGTYTCLVGSALTGGEVVAFEPYPPNAERLRENVARNDVDATVLPIALSAGSGEARLSVVDTTNPGTQESTLDTDDRERNRTVTTVPVPVERGDAVVRERDLAPPTVVKIDAEGAAPAVIDGFEGTLERDGCRLLCVEPHGNRAEIEESLGELGFDVGYVPLAGDRLDEDPTVFGFK